MSAITIIKEFSQFDDSIPKLWQREIHTDSRGIYSVLYNQDELKFFGLKEKFVQDSLSESGLWTMRGLHFQHPKAQAKYVAVVAGRVYDFVLDIRSNSKTLGVGAVVHLAPGQILFVPINFAHGFISLEPGTKVLYKVSKSWSPNDEKGINFFDPEINWQGEDASIVWKIIQQNNSRKDNSQIINKRDATWPTLAEAATINNYLPKITVWSRILFIWHKQIWRRRKK